MSRLHACAILLLATSLGAAQAHPVHEVVQNAYLMLSGGAVDLELEITAGPQVASRVLATLDGNHDGQVSHDEAAAFAVQVLHASGLLLDGRSAGWRPRSIIVPAYHALLEAHGTIVIYARAARPDHTGPATLIYHNGYSPAESRCDANIFIKPAASLRYRFVRQDRSQDGRTLAVGYAALRPPAS